LKKIIEFNYKDRWALMIFGIIFLFMPAIFIIFITCILIALAIIGFVRKNKKFKKKISII
jgi:uncharacterized membrane protein